MSRCCGIWLSDLSLRLIKYGWIVFTVVCFIAGASMMIASRVNSSVPEGVFAGGIMVLIASCVSALVWICWICRCGPCSDEQCCSDQSGFERV